MLMNDRAAIKSISVIPLKVFLVEDEPFLRMDLADQLQRLGWRVAEAGTADEAIRQVVGGLAFDLLVTDVNMPGMADGLDLAKVTRQTLPGTRIIVMSGLHIPHSEQHSFYDLFWEKPVSLDGEDFRALVATTRMPSTLDANWRNIR